MDRIFLSFHFKGEILDILAFWERIGVLDMWSLTFSKPPSVYSLWEKLHGVSSLCQVVGVHGLQGSDYQQGN